MEELLDQVEDRDIYPEASETGAGLMTASLSQQCEQSSLVIAGGKTFLSNTATTGLPDCVLEYDGEMVTHDGEAVIHGEAGSGWDLIAE